MEEEVSNFTDRSTILHCWVQGGLRSDPEGLHCASLIFDLARMIAQEVLLKSGGHRGHLSLARKLSQDVDEMRLLIGMSCAEDSVTGEVASHRDARASANLNSPLPGPF